MEKLYNQSEIYDLIETERRTGIIRSDWKAFLGDQPIRTLLDVSIGTGAMTLPLQELGITVSGSDLSDNMLSRCKMKAEQKGLPVELKRSDFRDLSCWDGQLFDCVVSTGNSIAYVPNEDIHGVLERMNSLVKPGGYICFDSRNWEKIRREKQRFYFYSPFFREDYRVNLVQVWDYNNDDTITFNLLYSFERDNRVFRREIFEEHYYPFKKDLALDKLASMGYGEFQLKPLPCEEDETDFDKIDWYRVIAKKK